MRLDEYDISHPVGVRVVSTTRITADEAPEEVREIVLEAPAEAFPVSAGQNIGVLAPAPSGFGKEDHLRLYSVADVPVCAGEKLNTHG